jgi:hypothetical protein
MMKCTQIAGLIFLLLAGNTLSSLANEAVIAPQTPRFRAVTIDAKVEIGYGVAVSDVDGDGRQDILLADKNLIVWYRNPAWEKHVIAEKLTALDHVCLAAADLNGDGKAEVSAGAGWNPSDTTGSGSVHYLIPPEDRTQRWEAKALPHEPTVHRMRWMKDEAGKYQLVVVPLHGRGNQNGQGAGVRILSYQMPAEPRGDWKTELIDDSLHMTHNFDVVQWDADVADELLVAAREGIFLFDKGPEKWQRTQLAGGADLPGAGEIRVGKLPGGRRFIATIEPMHGNMMALYTAPDSNENGGNGLWRRRVLADDLREGHALGCGDFLGLGYDQIVVGWRGKNAEGKTGIRLYKPLDNKGEQWRQMAIDDNIACEDLTLADLNRDKKLDIIASGRATKNLMVYFGE